MLPQTFKSKENSKEKNLQEMVSSYSIVRRNLRIPLNFIWLGAPISEE